MDGVLADFRSTLHTSFPAQVLAYDPIGQTVDVRPALLREYEVDDPSAPVDFDTLPDIYNVPILWLRAGGFVITFPIAVGDWVKIDCAEQSTLKWRITGQTREHPGLIDPHGLNGCVATPGWYPDTEKLANVSTTDLVLQSEDGATSVRITSGGEVVLGGVSGAQFVALANLVLDRLSMIADKHDKHTHTWTTTPAAGAAGATVATLDHLIGTVDSVAATKTKAV
jgi:hypothetical protein